MVAYSPSLLDDRCRDNRLSSRADKADVFLRLAACAYIDATADNDRRQLVLMSPDNVSFAALETEQIVRVGNSDYKSLYENHCSERLYCLGFKLGIRLGSVTCRRRETSRL